MLQILDKIAVISTSWEKQVRIKGFQIENRCGRYVYETGAMLFLVSAEVTDETMFFNKRHIFKLNVIDHRGFVHFYR